MARNFPQLPEHLDGQDDARATPNNGNDGFSWPNRSWHLTDILNSGLWFGWKIGTTWGHDLRWYQRWRRSAPDEIDGRQFLVMLGELRTSAGRCSARARVESQARLRDDEETRDVLLDLLRMVEHLSRTGATPADESSERNDQPGRADGRSQAFKEWLNDDHTPKEGLARLGDEFLDELGKLVDQGQRKSN